MNAEPKIHCPVCEDAGELNGEVCQQCCEHDEHDHFICLNCGHEGEASDYYDEDYGADR